MEYKKKQRPLKVRMLDGTVKTVMVDDSKTVTDMLMTICARIGESGVGAGGGCAVGRRRWFLQSSPASICGWGGASGLPPLGG